MSTAMQAHEGNVGNLQFLVHRLEGFRTAWLSARYGDDGVLMRKEIHVKLQPKWQSVGLS